MDAVRCFTRRVQVSRPAILISPSDHLFSAMVYDAGSVCVCVCVWFLSLVTRNNCDGGKGDSGCRNTTLS